MLKSLTDMAIRGTKSSNEIGERSTFGIKPRSNAPQTIRLNFHNLENIDDPEVLLEKLNQLLQSSTIPSLVKIGLRDCSPCMQAQETLEKIVSNSEGLNIITIDLDALSYADREIFMENFQAENRETGLPTIHFYSPGSTKALTEGHLVSNTWLGQEHLKQAIERYLPEALRTAQEGLHKV